MNEERLTTGSKELDHDEFGDFDEKFRKVNQHYRRGLFEARLDPASFDHVDVQPPNGISLEDAAIGLASTAMERLWFIRSEAKDPFDSEITTETFKTYARSIVNAYEIRDYFLRDTKIFDPFLEKVLNLLLQKAGEDILSTIDPLVKGHVADPELTRIADEFVLLALCAVNSLYRGTTEKYDEGCHALMHLDRIIGELSFAKHRESFGLYGLQRYLLGRLQFGLGRFKEAETAFAESAKFYSERIRERSRVDVRSSDEIEEARILSLRRATLARCLGSAYLYFVQSRLERSAELLRIGVPILTLDCGRVNAAYCELIEAMAIRALNADDDKTLIDCERQVQGCLKVFKDYVQESHYVPRAYIELARIKDCRAKRAFDDGKWEETLKLYDEIQALLDDVIDHISKSDGSRNRPIRAAALILRSQVTRHYLRMLYKRMDSLPLIEAKRVNECIKDAEDALSNAVSKQQRCEALLALGQAKLLSNTLTFGTLKHDSEEMKASREKVRDQYYKVLSENAGENPKITATALLCLTELEMNASVNFYYAQRYFERYKSMAQQIEDRKCQLFAENLRRQLERQHIAFFVDSSSEKGLQPDYWHEQLDKFLREQVVYQAARKYRGQLDDLPDQKGTKETGGRDDQATNSGAPRKKGKHSRQSILTKCFEEEFKVSRATASKLAGKLWPDFKKMLHEEEKLAKILNSPD